jgi:hypothetical protein
MFQKYQSILRSNILELGQISANVHKGVSKLNKKNLSTFLTEKVLD